jgi:hypothetical protein
MAIAAVAASKRIEIYGDAAVFIRAHGDSRRGCIKGWRFSSRTRCTRSVSMAIIAVAASKHLVVEFVVTPSVLEFYGDHRRGCMKGGNIA